MNRVRLSLTKNSSLRNGQRINDGITAIRDQLMRLERQRGFVGLEERVKPKNGFAIVFFALVRPRACSFAISIGTRTGTNHVNRAFVWRGLNDGIQCRARERPGNWF